MDRHSLRRSEKNAVLFLMFSCLQSYHNISSEQCQIQSKGENEQLHKSGQEEHCLSLFWYCLGSLWGLCIHSRHRRDSIEERMGNSAKLVHSIHQTYRWEILAVLWALHQYSVLEICLCLFWLFQMLKREWFHLILSEHRPHIDISIPICIVWSSYSSREDSSLKRCYSKGNNEICFER